MVGHVELSTFRRRSGKEYGSCQLTASETDMA